MEVSGCLWEGVTGEATAGVNFVGEDACLDAGVFVHDFFRFVRGGVEDAEAADIAIVGDGADDGEQAISSQSEVAATVLPDYSFRVRCMNVWADFEDEDAVVAGGGHHLLHELVGDGGHGLCS